MDTEERSVQKVLSHSISDKFEIASDASQKVDITTENLIGIKNTQEDLKEDERVDREDSSCSSSSDDDNENLDAKFDSETHINSDEYMSNISEEECAVFMCSECGKKFNNGVSLKAHLAKKHNPRALINCELCGSKYRGDFVEHLESEHSSLDGRYFCKKCDFICTDYETIMKHHHDRDAFNVCKQCGKMYKSKENYKLHMLIHNNGGCKRRKEKFSCETCGKKFFLSCLVKNNSNSDTGMESYHPWKCQVCRSSSQNTTTSQHSTTRSSGRVYKCSECNRAFLRNGELKKHMLSHAGESPFV